MKVGIDPGLSGAIAFISQNEIFLLDLPLLPCSWIKPYKLKTGKMKIAQMIDVPKLSKMISNCPHEIESITMEIVHTMPKQGIASAFTFGGSFYAAHAAITMAGHIPRMVTPQFWKAKCGLIGKDKDASRLLALKMYPVLEPRLNLKKHNGRSDALFIGVCP